MLNADPAEGPISSVRVALAGPGPTADYYFVHPVDIPGVTLHDVAALLDAARAAPRAGAVLPSVSGRRAHPVLLRAALVPQVLALAHGATLRDLWRSPEVELVHVELQNPWLRFDVNTPEDYQELLAHWPGGTPARAAGDGSQQS